MAAAAARAAVQARLQVQRKERDRKVVSMSGLNLDDDKKMSVINTLRENDSTMLVAKLLEGE